MRRERLIETSCQHFGIVALFTHGCLADNGVPYDPCPKVRSSAEAHDTVNSSRLKLFCRESLLLPHGFYAQRSAGSGSFGNLQGVVAAHSGVDRAFVFAGFA